MSLWSRLFGKKEEKAERQLSVQEALEAARKKLAELDLSAADKLCTEMKAAVSEVFSSVKSLSDATPPKMDSRLAAPVLESRKQVVMNVKRRLEEISFPDKTSLESLQALNENVKKTLAAITSGNIKHSYYTSIAFQTRMDSIGKAVARLASLSNALGSELNRITLQNAPYNRILEQSRELEQSQKRLEQTEKEVSETSEQVNAREKRLQELSADIEKKVVEKEQNELSEAQKKKEELEQQVFSHVSAFSRAMKKYGKAGNIDKKTEAVLNKYIEEPTKTFFSDSENHLQKILSDIKAFLPRLELKDSEKTAAALDSTDFEKLKTISRQHCELEQRVAELQGKITPEIEKKERLKGDLGSTALDLKSIKTRASLLQAKQEEQKQKIAALQNALNASALEISKNAR